MCVWQLVNLTFNLPARQEHETGNCFWDSQSEKSLCKQEEPVTVLLSGVNHFTNDLPTGLRENVNLGLILPLEKST